MSLRGILRVLHGHLAFVGLATKLVLGKDLIDAQIGHLFRRK